MKRIISEVSLRNASITAGIGLLVMAVLAPVADFAILKRLVVPEDEAKTVSNIVASGGLFRIGISLFLIVAILDIIVAWALYVFLKPVNRSLSLLAALLRIVYAALLGVVVFHLISILDIQSGAGYLSAFTTQQIQAQVMLSLIAFQSGWETALVIFGLHLFILGWLFFRAGYMRRILGVLLIISSMGYLIGGFGKLLCSQYNVSISMFTFIGEVVLIFWLLIIGQKMKKVPETQPE